MKNKSLINNSDLKNLFEKIEEIKKSPIKKIIDERIESFKEFQKKENNDLFKELCFCLLTANCQAQACISIQEKIGHEFCNINQTNLAKKLRNQKYRYPNKRSEYIFEAQKNKNKLKNILTNTNDEQRREWLIKNIKGLGYKEASHFLRNIGYDNYAIIDKHIITLLTNYHLISKPKNLNKTIYLNIEHILKIIANNSNLTLAELDLYLWYMQTGKVLK
jgi:N-glycosylase/DNA lyase